MIRLSLFAISGAAARPWAHAVKAASLLVLAMWLQGCSTLAYYMQSVDGQMEVLTKRRPIASVLTDNHAPPMTRQRLALVQQMRQFAVEKLGLPDNGSYRSYSDVGRRYVVYNVFATPELSLKPVRSCFLIVGCLDYRGYFRESMARAHARSLQQQGYDVFVGGVAAYSTLGWFNDPVLNTMLNWDEARIAKFIFHELAHQRLYIKNDTAFNEAFAETVAEVGLEQWLNARSGTTHAEALRRAEVREHQFIALVLATKEDLERIYTAPASDGDKRVQKREAFERLRASYDRLRAAWNGDGSYDAWMQTDLNNAKISAVVTYNEEKPAFRALLEASNGDMPTFYRLTAEVGQLPADERHDCLEALRRLGVGGLPSCRPNPSAAPLESTTLRSCTPLNGPCRRRAKG